MISRKQHNIYRLQAQIKQSLFFGLSSVIIDHHVNPLNNIFIRCKFLQHLLLVRIFLIFRLNFHIIRLSELSCWYFGWRLLLVFGKCRSWLTIIQAVFKLMTPRRRHTFLGRRRLFATLDSIVNFLDLNISLDKTSLKLKYSIYFKKTNTFYYLSTSSNHKNSIYKKSLFMRIRRNCSC